MNKEVKIREEFFVDEVEVVTRGNYQSRNQSNEKNIGHGRGSNRGGEVSMNVEKQKTSML